MVKHLLTAIILAFLLCVPAHAVEVDTDANNAVDVTYGGTNAATAADARTNLDVPSKTGSGATGTWGVNISGTAATADTLTSALGITLGGTGATTAPDARDNLGLTIGTSIPATDGTGATGDWSINATNVTGTVAVANGGTGAATAANARTNLGLAIGSDVQAYSALLASWAAYTDPNVNRLLYWNDTSGAFASYVPTAWRLVYFGASSALSELAFGAQYTILQSGGASAAPTWTATLNFDPLVLPNGANPTVDATGETALDTDGANEAGDMTLRIFDGTNVVAMGRKLHCIQGTIVKPQDLADATRDKFPLWCNNTGMVFTITEIKGYSDTDNTTLTVNLVPDTDWTSVTAVDAIEIATNSTGVYTVVETTITHATVSHDECLVLDFDDTDDPGWVKLTICGWFNAAVD